MKRFIKLAVIAGCFWFVSGTACLAAPQCSGNVAGTGTSDPACWTSAGSNYWKSCNWYHWGSDCCHTHWFNNSNCSLVAGGCGNSSYYHIQRTGYGHNIYYYTNNCGDLSCNNPNSGPPPNYGYWVSNTSYTCHYISGVSAWSACSGHIQVPTAVTWTTKSGTNCSNASIPVSQTCDTAPTAPTLSGPAEGNINNSYGFTASGAADLDGDNLTYKFNWGDGTGDQATSPAVASGTDQTLSHSWTTAGSKSVKAMACDALGTCSGWSNVVSINIKACTPDLNPTWSECSESCGTNGEQNRTVVNADCTVSIETQGCNQVACPQWREVVP